MTDAMAAGDMGPFAKLDADSFAHSMAMFVVEYERW
jgi:hypothetical protein